MKKDMMDKQSNAESRNIRQSGANQTYQTAENSQLVTKFDAISRDDRSQVTYLTEISKISGGPSTTLGPSIQSAHLEIHCDFLTKELELEREKRENL